jgi:hypothetical protein
MLASSLEWESSARLGSRGDMHRFSIEGRWSFPHL